ELASLAPGGLDASRLLQIGVGPCDACLLAESLDGSAESSRGLQVPTCVVERGDPVERPDDRGHVTDARTVCKCLGESVERSPVVAAPKRNVAHPDDRERHEH